MLLLLLLLLITDGVAPANVVGAMVGMGAVNGDGGKDVDGGDEVRLMDTSPGPALIVGDVVGTSKSAGGLVGDPPHL